MEQASVFGMDMGTFVGVLGILIGAVLARYFYRKSIRTKILSISYSDPFPLYVSIPKVKATYDSTEINALSETYFLLWNRGTSPIEASDFVSPITLKNADGVLRLDIDDKDVAASATIDPTDHSIRIDILRPNEAIVFCILAKEYTYKPDLSIVMKSADMSSFLRFNRAILPTTMAIGISIVFGLVVVLYADYIGALAQTTFADRMISAGLTLLFVVLLAVAAVVLDFVLNRTVKGTTPPVVWNYFQLERAASAARTAADRLRLQMKRVTTEQLFAPNEPSLD